MSAVRIENEAFGDKRFDALAKLCQLADAEHALGKMALIWRECTDRHVYVLPESFICIVLGDAGPSAIEKSGLGERVADGLRIKGTRGRIEWLKKLKKNASKGGRARAKQVAAKRQAKGCQEPANTDPTPSPLTLTPPLSPSDPLSKKQNQKRGAAGAAQHQPATDAFHVYYVRSHSGAKPTWDPKHIGMVSTLVAKHGADEVVRRIQILDRSPPRFPPQPWDLATFVQHFDKCAIAASNSNGTAGRVEPKQPDEYPEGDIAL